ncbi:MULTISPECIES: hypothetical protein [Persicobacter]|uniref:Uncharacterized protein n=1 Tax=Persicobacter diffluens TaxID=981 RepID=A0AAN4VZV0_9BACT|nr:hypothetical protein [Persicobacter sp. CCB-QB2]GJM61742.1 hypothetical protein PEDI_22940 [Persicobacter diffluens]
MAETVTVVDPKSEALEKACSNALTKLEKLDLEPHAELREKLAWVIGSYNYDKNPEGLVEFGEKTLKALLAYKKEKPRQVAKKLIDDLEKALAAF